MCLPLTESSVRVGVVLFCSVSPQDLAPHLAHRRQRRHSIFVEGMKECCLTKFSFIAWSLSCWQPVGGQTNLTGICWTILGQWGVGKGSLRPSQAWVPCGSLQILQNSWKWAEITGIPSVPNPDCRGWRLKPSEDLILQHSNLLLGPDVLFLTSVFLTELTRGRNVFEKKVFLFF